jgi:hypothetical protein
MTKHKATPEQWAQIELQAQRFNDDSCLIELRDRVEALEAAQRPTQVNADISRQPWAAMRFRGVTLLPPIDCADPDSWIADRIYEMGLADGKNATTGNTAPVTRDRAEDAPESSDSLVEEVVDAITDASAAYGTADEPARAAILAVADWFEQHGWHTSAARLRQEVG